MRFFEVKVKYEKMLDNGDIKAITEAYAVDAISFTEAEARITEMMQPFIKGEFEVVAEKIAPYTTLIRQKDADIYFLCKFTHTVRNELTGAEQKKHLETILICAYDFNDAKAQATQYMVNSSADWQIDTLKETKLLDVYTTFDVMGAHGASVSVDVAPTE